jgi:multidrug efflux system membrane fusion protein
MQETSLTIPMRSVTAICCSALIGLAGCKRPQPDTSSDVQRPAFIETVSAAPSTSALSFPGRVRSVQRAELAFAVAGTLKELPTQEGQRVEKGSILAQLDAASYERTLAGVQAEYDAAKGDADRTEQLFRNKLVPFAEIDARRAALEISRSKLAAARAEVSDCTLRAPFSGAVSKRYVENFQRVQAKEPVLSLQDLDHLEVVIHVPERVVRSEPMRHNALARIEGMTGGTFPVELKSYSTEADPLTQTYEVVLSFAKPDGVQVLPGMGATIQVGTGSDAPVRGSILVPLAAVVGASGGEPFVWTVDPASSRVAVRPVKVGALHGDRIAISAGLTEGEQIVTAGVHSLRAGMQVRPMTDVVPKPHESR